jgi:hypothetical protein
VPGVNREIPKNNFKAAIQRAHCRLAGSHVEYRAPLALLLMNYLTLPGLLFATAALARMACRNLSRPLFYVALAVCWVATSPIAWYQATICYPDLGFALWSTLALLATMKLLEMRPRIPAEAPWSRRNNWAILAGGSAGLAVVIKLGGMYPGNSRSWSNSRRAAKTRREAAQKGSAKSTT